jgi:hypothetical protein
MKRPTNPEATHPESKLAGNHTASIVVDRPFTTLVDSHFNLPLGVRFTRPVFLK